MMSIPCCVAVPYLLSMKCTFTWLLLKYSKVHVLWYIGALTHKCKYSEFDMYNTHVQWYTYDELAN